jgi:hypothetical protein
MSMMNDSAPSYIHRPGAAPTFSLRGHWDTGLQLDVARLQVYPSSPRPRERAAATQVEPTASAGGGTAKVLGYL